MFGGLFTRKDLYSFSAIEDPGFWTSRKVTNWAMCQGGIFLSPVLSGGIPC